MGDVLHFTKKNVRNMTDEELKALWDKSEEPYFEVDGIELTAIHFELNRRGLGRYCAV